MYKGKIMKKEKREEKERPETTPAKNLTKFGAGQKQPEKQYLTVIYRCSIMLIVKK